MVVLTLMEEMKDKASRLIPTPYMEIVEECTAPKLSIPTYDHVMFLCETVNSKPSEITDVVRALKRRIADESPAVKHLTVQILDAMIKNCGNLFHVEIAGQKALLRDLEHLAEEQPTTARGMQAREAALLLVLNLSIWFAGHPDTRCHILTTIADDVRSVSGPNAFDGIHPEATVRLRSHVPPSLRLSNRPPGVRRNEGNRPTVKAIPINYPTESLVANMLDTCSAFSEYINNAALLDDGTVCPDDVIVGFQDKLQKDHEYVTLLLSSNLKFDRDVIAAIAENQRSVMESLGKPRNAVKADADADASVIPPSVDRTALPRERETPPPQPQQGPPTAATPKTQQEQPPAPAANVMDDLFSAPAPPATSESAPAPAAAGAKPASTFADPFADLLPAQPAAPATSSPAAPTVEATAVPAVRGDAEEADHRENADDVETDERVGDEREEAREAAAHADKDDDDNVPVIPDERREASVQMEAAYEDIPIDASPSARNMTEPATKSNTMENDDDFEAFLKGQS